MKNRNSSAVAIFLGALLTFCFAVGLIYTRHPETILRMNTFSYAWVQFVQFCANGYVFFGLLGLPTLIVSLIVSLIREHKSHHSS